jgi:hypothetical protein
VNRFSAERSVKEVNYIAQNVPKNIHSLSIADLNFGMFRGDLEVCDAIVDTQKRFDYPWIVGAATGKNAKDKIIETIQKLRGTLKLTMAVQSMDDEVLGNIQRKNISEKAMIELAPVIKQSGLQTKAEVILGLPGDSFKSHMHTIKVLLDADIDEILVFTCMVLPGSVLSTDEQRKRWGFRTMHRILARDFTRLENGRTVIETEEVVVSSNTMSFEDYVNLRLFNFLLAVTNTDTVYTGLRKYVKEQGLGLFELVTKMYKNLKSSPQSIQDVCRSYKQATISELWNSPEEISSNYESNSEYKKLLTGEAGINVLYHHQALVVSNHMIDWTSYVFANLHELLVDTGHCNNDVEIQVHDLKNFCEGLSYNPLGGNRLDTNPRYKFTHNIIEWLKDEEDYLSLSSFKFKTETSFEFRFTDKQYKIIEDQLNRYEDTIIGKSKALFSSTIIPSHYYWRQPYSLVNQIYEEGSTIQ